MRRGLLAFAVTFVLALSGIATASVFAGGGDDKPEGNAAGCGRPRRTDPAVPHCRILRSHDRLLASGQLDAR